MSLIRPSKTPRQSPFSPFISSLLITDLPPHIQPRHLTHILSTRGDASTEKHDHGISFIRIYTKPRHRPKVPTRTQARPNFFSRLFTLNQPKLEPATSAQHHPKSTSTPGRTPPSSPISQTSASQLGLGPDTRSEVVEVPSDPRLMVFVEEGARQEEEEEEVTIAELRFSSEEHRYRALYQLRRSTIDGQKIGLRTKTWDGVALRRLWRRVT